MTTSSLFFFELVFRISRRSLLIATLGDATKCCNPPVWVVVGDVGAAAVDDVDEEEEERLGRLGLLCCSETPVSIVGAW